MTIKYISMIRNFYKEKVFDGGATYIPEYYDRNFNHVFTDKNIMISGLGHTFKSRNYHTKNKTVYVGGIRISTDYMHDEGYNGTYEQVLYSFLNGWHGLPGEQYGGIPSQYMIYESMLDYKKELEKELGKKFEIEIN